MINNNYDLSSKHFHNIPDAHRKKEMFIAFESDIICSLHYLIWHYVF